MKKIFSVFVLTLSLLAMWSCGDEDTSYVPKIDLKLLSASIDQDAEIDAQFTRSVTLSYNVAVAINPSANITLNGRKVDARLGISSTKDVEIPLTLEVGTQYTLSVPAGAVVAKVDAKSTAAAYTLKFKTKAASEPDPDEDDEPNAAIRMARALGFGWNLGNHFDTGANEDANGKPIDFQKPKWGYWDGAKPTEQLYINLAKMGVKTVRIPVTWGLYQTNDGNYTISENYMAEVEQNVQWALNAGLYVLLNTHHDEYWQDIISAVTNKTLNTQIEDRLTKTWTQIANRFINCGNHLVFETMNEVHDSSWGWKTGYNYKPVYTMMNEWNKVCVDAIRATGGNNATRWIGIPGFCASPSFTVGYVTIPNNDKHIMIAVHSYDPFKFTTFNTSDLKDAIDKWGHKYKGNDDDEQAIQKLFKNLHDKYVANGIPCYMGEFGCVKRMSSVNEKYREYYLEYFTRCAYLNHIPMMLWDNNATSGEVFHFINHNDGAFYERALMEMMIKAGTSTDPAYTQQSINDKAK